jgi:hypothetical protein
MNKPDGITVITPEMADELSGLKPVPILKNTK